MSSLKFHSNFPRKVHMVVAQWARPPKYAPGELARIKLTPKRSFGRSMFYGVSVWFAFWVVVGLGEKWS